MFKFAPWLRTRQAVYQQWTHTDSTEMQNLAAELSKSDTTVNTTSYKPQFEIPDTPLPVDAPVTRTQRLLGTQFTGWRFGVLNFAAWAVVVFLINLILIIVASSTDKSKRGVLLEEDCTRVKRLNTGLHVIINILSTILLSGSNYCMQCLSAPTREEIDVAHGSLKRKWLDIGVPSIRNVRHINRRRMILWSLLGASSLPLHLLYNSAVFSSISSNSYWAFSVSESFLKESECRNCTNEPNFSRYQSRYYFGYKGLYESEVSSTLESLWTKARAGNLERLEPAECLSEYAQIIQSNRRNLLLVASDTNFPPAEENYFLNGSYAYWADSFSAGSARGATQAADAYGWICTGTNHSLDVACSTQIGEIQRDLSAWRVGWYCQHNETETCASSRWPVEYCMSEKAEPHCKLHFEPTIAIVVTILNVVKAALMFFLAFRISDEPLMTIGDAVASFLVRNDPYTTNMCLTSVKDLKKKGYTAGPRQWNDRLYRWKDVTSKIRRIVIVLMFTVCITVVAVLFYFGLEHVTTNESITSLGFGVVDPRTSITGLPTDIISNAVIANTPQLILSILYFSYNALFTAMLMGYEWTSYTSKQKGLRVSRQPQGEQRSTYFLQLPYRFSVPLMVLSGGLHWLVSQSIFLVAIDFYDVSGEPGLGEYSFGEDMNLTTLGYSLSPIISVMVLAGSMIISIIGLGFIPYKRGMPLAGSCSIAISAACHNAPIDFADNDAIRHIGERKNAALGRLKWGVVSTSSDGVGHCAFTTEEVEAPVKGRVYAGPRTQ